MVVAGHREREVGLTLARDVLDDHVHIDVGLRHRAQDLIGNARLIRHALHGHLGFITVEGDA